MPCVQCTEAAGGEPLYTTIRRLRRPLHQFPLNALAGTFAPKTGSVSTMSTCVCERSTSVVADTAQRPHAPTILVFFGWVCAMCAERHKSPRRIQIGGSRDESDNQDQQHQTKPQNQKTTPTKTTNKPEPKDPRTNTAVKRGNEFLSSRSQ